MTKTAPFSIRNRFCEKKLNKHFRLKKTKIDSKYHLLVKNDNFFLGKKNNIFFEKKIGLIKNLMIFFVKNNEMYEKS